MKKPETLGKIGSSAWDATIDSLEKQGRQFDPYEYLLLVDLCHLYDEVEEMRKIVNDEGSTIMSSDGKGIARQHPAETLLETKRKSIRAISQELMLTSKSKKVVVKTDKGNVKSPLADLAEQRKKRLAADE